MTKHRTFSTDKLAGGVLLGAVASALAAAALGGAGSANATCASISGISAGTGCTSSVTSVAIGLGSGTTATASGLFTVAVANGITNTGADTTTANSQGAFSLAYAGGKGAAASTNGSLNAAIAQGTNAFATAGLNTGDVGNVAIDVADNSTIGFGAVAGGFVGTPGFGNIAANLSNDSSVTALGGLNSAFSIGGSKNAVVAEGVGNNATNLLGSNNEVEAVAGTGLTSPGLSAAFNIAGNNNVVEALNGPLAVAGAVGVSNHNGLGTNPPSIVQSGTGFNIKTPLNP